MSDVISDAENGDAFSQTVLAEWYLDGTNGVAKDQNLAFYWFEKAASQGYSEAQNNLACCYAYGLGVAPNKDLAATWWLKAAEQGDSAAQASIGSCYIKGEGVKPDAKQAFYWTKKSADQNDRDGLNNLGLLYADGCGVKQDIATAKSLLDQAVQQGHPTAQDTLEHLDELLSSSNSEKSGGCYVATAVYGSYDCPEVWVLRRYRDNTLSQSLVGRGFVQLYYAWSPALVRRFGNASWFNCMCRSVLDNLIRALRKQGVNDTQYYDR
jgi:hypothetical protein